MGTGLLYEYEQSHGCEMKHVQEFLVAYMLLAEADGSNDGGVEIEAVTYAMQTLMEQSDEVVRVW
jgi:hypothetical protein